MVRGTGHQKIYENRPKIIKIKKVASEYQNMIDGPLAHQAQCHLLKAGKGEEMVEGRYSLPGIQCDGFRRRQKLGKSKTRSQWFWTRCI